MSPMRSRMRLTKCNPILSSLGKTSAASPNTFPSSSTPIINIPPCALRNPAMVFNADSCILSSGWLVCRLVQSVELNSTTFLVGLAHHACHLHPTFLQELLVGQFPPHGRQGMPSLHVFTLRGRHLR